MSVNGSVFLEDNFEEDRQLRNMFMQIIIDEHSELLQTTIKNDAKKSQNEIQQINLEYNKIMQNIIDLLKFASGNEILLSTQRNQKEFNQILIDEKLKESLQKINEFLKISVPPSNLINFRSLHVAEVDFVVTFREKVEEVLLKANKASQLYKNIAKNLKNADKNSNEQIELLQQLLRDFVISFSTTFGDLNNKENFEDFQSP